MMPSATADSSAPTCSGYGEQHISNSTCRGSEYSVEHIQSQLVFPGVSLRLAYGRTVPHFVVLCKDARNGLLEGVMLLEVVHCQENVVMLQLSRLAMV